MDRQLRTSRAHIHALGDCAEVGGLNLMYVMPLMAGARALGKTLAGQPSEVRYGPMPIVVKTPACPLVLSPAPAGRHGEWQVEGRGADIRALCRGAQGELLGYALTGAEVQGRLALNRQLPDLLS
ncbi:Rubredoxin-NAD(+) reductase [compost metagenome]